jgi:hypothetical protein
MHFVVAAIEERLARSLVLPRSVEGRRCSILLRSRGEMAIAWSQIGQ